ncbi:hypothetical protein HMPREF9554_02029 [Treponema phagedenis F0421]|nr:hypothetical protein HMPREF9554_02029 [Treponema phagedenis F0421]
MAKQTLRVLKPYKHFCFKTSLLSGTTGIRARYHRNAEAVIA